jgi:hypothetical protein
MLLTNWPRNHMWKTTSASSKHSPQTSETDRILHTEKVRRKGRVARPVTGKTQGGNVTCIQRVETIDDGNETIHACDTETEVNDTLMVVNSSKYQQCDNSSFLKEPLLTQFGYLGDTPQTEAVLEGTYEPPPETDYFAKLLLGHMGYPVGMNSTNCIPTRITNEEHALSWKRAKEYTSAGISGLHSLECSKLRLKTRHWSNLMHPDEVSCTTPAISTLDGTKVSM